MHSNKLVGSGSLGFFVGEGSSVSISGDGTIAVLGGPYDNFLVGATWVFQIQSNNSWAQVGNKLVGTGYAGDSIMQGCAVAINSDGNTIIVGGKDDVHFLGAAWVFVNDNNDYWSQQGNKIVPNNYVGNNIYFGSSVSLSSDGNVALIGSFNDSATGAAWIFVRNGLIWTQASKLVLTNAIATPVLQYGQPGSVSVSLSGDGYTAIVGNSQDNNFNGACWVFIQQNGQWVSQGGKLLASDTVGRAYQGAAVALNYDGSVAVMGAPEYQYSFGAVYVFIRTNGMWAQQGNRLVPNDTSVLDGGYVLLGGAVAVNWKGDKLAFSSAVDAGTGAVWVYTLNSGNWTQYGPKITQNALQYRLFESSLAMSLSGYSIITGESGTNNYQGGAWVFTSL